MRVETYKLLKSLITDAGFGDDITWAEKIEPPRDALEFAREHAFVVCNSGMRAKTACLIFRKVMAALEAGRPLSGVFGHEHKCQSIQYVHDHREEFYARFKEVERDGTEAVLEFLQTLPHIGGITRYHLAKNCSISCIKPDRHLVRIASHFDTTPEELCRALALASGDKITTVDTVIWRAASLELIRYEGGVPLIPDWPDELDEMSVGCPQCGAPARLSVGFCRRRAMVEWSVMCEECRCGFYVAPRAGGMWVAPIQGYGEFEEFLLSPDKIANARPVHA